MDRWWLLRLAEFGFGHAGDERGGGVGGGGVDALGDGEVGGVAAPPSTLKNVVPFLVFGVIYIVAAIVASIPFGLGWIVLVPVSLLTAYVSYEDVFGE